MCATTNPKWPLWLELAAFAPLFEEALFRGCLSAGIESTALQPIGAVVATSALWAIVHLQHDTYGVLTIVGLGLLLGTARLLTGSLAVPFNLHAAANVTATLEAKVFS